MKLSVATASAFVLPCLATRYVMYYDQYHIVALPNRTVAAGIDTVILAFANSSLFTTVPYPGYTPALNITAARPLFDDGTKFLHAIGGWGDNAGFGAAAKDEASQDLFAKNVAQMVIDTGADGVDIDWEYPGGNGADYKLPGFTNDLKVGEIAAYPAILAKIKALIGDKLLTIAVPGLERDMIAFTAENAPKIWAAVDEVNVMTYDLMNRRDNITSHQTGIAASIATIDKYISLGLDPAKMNLGFALYAKYFATDDPLCATQPIGCKTAVLENPIDGSDTGLSAALTFEAANYLPVPAKLTASTDGTCGAVTATSCEGNSTSSGGSCCSGYGYCGDTTAHCGLTCQPDYSKDGKCPGVTATASWEKARVDSVTDEVLGGQYYFDVEANIFWTMDTPALITRKFDEIVKAKGLGGVMAWSFGEDSHDYSHLLAIQAGVAASRASANTC